MIAAHGRAGLEAVVLRAWQRRGPLAMALWPLSLAYGRLAAHQRHIALADTHAVGRPVVVVGNQIAGGAGKTPTVIALVRHLQASGWHPGVVSRGHGRDTERDPCIRCVRRNSLAAEVGDEPLLVHLRTGAPVAVGRDRLAAAEQLLQTAPGTDVVVADDGLQHLRLARDVEVVVFDRRGAGNGWLLPAGPLREPLDTPSTARQRLVLYNADRPSTALPGHTLQHRLSGAVPLDAWWRGDPASAAALQSLRGQPVTAAAGIADPLRFFASLRDAGLDVAELPLPDHATFDPLPWPATALTVIVTEKDAVKLQPDRLARERPGLQVWVAPLDFVLPQSFLAAVDAALAPLRPLPPTETTPWTPA